MGSYAELYLDSKIFYYSEDSVNWDILSIFSDSDRKVLSNDEYFKLTPFSLKERRGVDPSDAEDQYYIYQAQVSHVRDRLDLMGINITKLHAIFDSAIAEHVESVEEGFGLGDPKLVAIRSQYNAENQIEEDLDKYTFEYWLDLVEKLVSSNIGLEGFEFGKYDVLKSSTFSTFSETFGFPGYFLDFRYLIRVFLQYLPDTKLVTLDYTDLVMSGHEDPDSLLCQSAIEASGADYSISEKIIILSEGSSDITYLEKSLNILYPHVSTRFSFADFSSVRYSGGVSSIISSLKVIASMSIMNRVIAIFDADSAATDAIRSLEGLTLPENIKYMQLPHIAFASNYPTVGPTGNANLNVNGLACSTEMYLPKEILRDNDGHYFPIHWSGYIKSISQYQGEISQKREIMQRFLDITRRLEDGRSKVSDYSWENMHSIFKSIFSKLSE